MRRSGTFDRGVHLGPGKFVPVRLPIQDETLIQVLLWGVIGFASRLGSHLTKLIELFGVSKLGLEV